MFSQAFRNYFTAFRRVLTLSSKRVPHVIGQEASNTMSTFPDTLKGFGYAFNENGQLRQIDPNDDSITDKPFEFEVSDNAKHNQEHYEAIGEVINDHIYQMLLVAGLHKIYVPSTESPNANFVFGTKTNFKDTKKLLFLIHGSGVVRAGQWSRSLIINQSINHGTQLPYIKRAIDLGYDVLVTNTNNRFHMVDGDRVVFKGSRSPEQHIITVWNELIEPVFDTIESFAVAAHSYGGVVTLEMMDTYPDEFLKKCFGIALTDSVHSVSGLSTKLIKWCEKNARNYVGSSEPLNTKLKSRPSDIPCFSAGHTKHEWTSWACMEVLFPFLEEKYATFLNTKENAAEKSEEESKEESDESLDEDERNESKKKKSEQREDL